MWTLESVDSGVSGQWCLWTLGSVDSGVCGH